MKGKFEGTWHITKAFRGSEEIQEKARLELKGNIFQRISNTENGFGFLSSFQRRKRHTSIFIRKPNLLKVNY